MNTKNILLTGGIGLLGLGLMTVPKGLQAAQDPAPTPAATKAVAPPAAPAAPKIVTRMKIMRSPQERVMVQGPDAEGNEEFALAFADGGGSWLGVETQEVTAEKAKELKLSAERGVVIGKVLDESPAAKAGLKNGDVVTEINGQRIEGAAQFPRMIPEIPPARTGQLPEW